MSLIEAEADRGMVVMIDESTPGTTYFGFSKTSNDTSAEVWSIKRMVEASGITTITRALGSPAYTKAWDDRATYPYT